MKNCWVVSEGKIGMLNQALAIAEALKLNIEVKTVRLKPLWNLFSPSFRLFKKLAFDDSSDSLCPPFPEFVVACGRKSIIAALYIKEQSPNTKVIYVQDPKISPKYFDAVICPKHDNLKGANVISMVGTVNRLHDDLLKREALRFASTFEHLITPRVGIFIGGPTKKVAFSLKHLRQLIKTLNNLNDRYQASFIITCSRRSPPEFMDELKLHFENKPNFYIYDFQGDNPYYAMLSLCNALIVSSDSVNMISESASTEKPLYLIKLPCNSSKFDQFHNEIIALKRAQWLGNELNFNKVKPFNQMNSIISKLKSILKI